MPITIPQFLLPRGGPSIRTLRHLSRQTRTQHNHHNHTTKRYASAPADSSKPRVLEKPDKFRPPSHPARRVLPTRNGKVVNYGPRLTEKEKAEQSKKSYPHMFPAEGTVMYRFLTNRAIHVWIAMGVLTSLATFTFTTNFKANSPFADLLPPWSGLLSHPVDTIAQAISVYKMDVNHRSIEAQNKRLEQFSDARKRHQYRVAHGISEGPLVGPDVDAFGDKGRERAAVEREERKREMEEAAQEQYVDFEGKRRPVKKWLGIW